jgi:hypothetical protein
MHKSPPPPPPLLRFCRSLVAAEFFPCGNFSFPPSPSPSPSPSPIPRTAFTSRFRRWRLDTSAGRGVGRLCRSRGYLLATDGAYKETKSAFCDCSRSIAAAQRAPAPALLPRDRTRPYCGRVAAITPVSPLPPPAVAAALQIHLPAFTGPSSAAKCAIPPHVIS